MSVPTDPVMPAPRRTTPRWVDGLLVVAVALAIGGVAFAVGRLTAPPALPVGATLPGFADGGVVVTPGSSTAPVVPGASGAPGGGPLGGGPGAVPIGGAGFGLSMRGEVVAIDADSITIRLESGEEQTLALDGSTEFREAAETSADTVAVGATVDVQAALQPPADGGGGGGQPALTAGSVTVTP